MRESPYRGTESPLANTDLALLGDVVQRLSFIGNLLITPEGVRQIILPSSKREIGQGPRSDSVHHRRTGGQRTGRGALVIWNTHALVCLASTTENIYIMLPTEFENGTLTLTFRGIPQAISSFVKLSKVFYPLRIFGSGHQ